MEEVIEDSILQENISKKIPFWQNPKIPIFVALVVFGLTILASSWFVWENQKLKQVPGNDQKIRPGKYCEEDSDCGWGTIQGDPLSIGCILGGVKKAPTGYKCICNKTYIPPKCEMSKISSEVTLTTDKTEYEQGEEITASLSYGTSIYEWDGGAAWSIQRWEDGAWITIQRRDDPYFHRTNTPECTEVGLEEIQKCPPLKLFERETWYEVKSMPKLTWDQLYEIEEKTFQCKTGKIERIETWPCVIFGLVASGKYRIRFEYAASIDPNNPFNRNIEIRYAEKEFTIKEK